MGYNLKYAYFQENNFPENQKKNNLSPIAKIGYQSKALNKTIPNMCFLFYRNQKNTEFS